MKNYASKLTGIFIRTSSILLFITAGLKLISSFGSARILHTVDPIFHISFRHIFQVAAVVELGVAVICLFSKNQKVQAGLIALLAHDHPAITC
jgi:hypothetical protein